MKGIEFLRSRLRGPRFDNGEIPLDVLGDLAALREMVIEIAKWRFLKENPGRQRVPRGFRDSVDLKLTALESGSVTAVISLATTYPALDGAPLPYQSYFEQAREDVANAMDVVAPGAHANVMYLIGPESHAVPLGAFDPEGYGGDGGYLPTKFFTYFDRLGRSLRDDESLELSTPNRRRAARLTRESRLELFQISRNKPFTQEVALRGPISEVDQNEMTFELQTVHGHKVGCPIPEQYYDTVMEAFNGFHDGVLVAVSGTGRYAHPNRLLALDFVGQIRLLDPLDVPTRLGELLDMKDGWLDGHGKAPNHQGLAWLSNSFESHYPTNLQLPHTYPTPEGRIQAEWSLGTYEISLEVNLSDHTGEWHTLDLSTKDSTVRDLDLDTADDWAWFAGQIGRLGRTLE